MDMKHPLYKLFFFLLLVFGMSACSSNSAPVQLNQGLVKNLAYNIPPFLLKKCEKDSDGNWPRIREVERALGLSDEIKAETLVVRCGKKDTHVVYSGDSSQYSAYVKFLPMSSRQSRDGKSHVVRVCKEVARDPCRITIHQDKFQEFSLIWGGSPQSSLGFPVTTQTVTESRAGEQEVSNPLFPKEGITL